VKTIRTYVDTSIFGGIQDDKFSVPSRQAGWRALTPEQTEEVPLTAEARDLAAEYVRAGVLGQASMADALHVAAATVAGADLILSWNFRYIVNFDRIRGFNSVNLALGYRTMTILSPLEVAHAGREDL
jgi:hypothetical protein